MNDSALPNTIRLVRDHLTHAYRPWIDLSDVAQRAPREQETVLLVRALAAQAVSMLTSCSPEEAAASVVDGAQDRGIDAIAFSKGGSEVWVVQAKWSDTGRARLSEADALGLVTGLRLLADRSFEGFNPRIRAAGNRLNEALGSPRCRIHLVVALAGDAGMTLQAEHQLELVGEAFGFADRIPVHVRTLGLADLHSAARADAESTPVTLSASLTDGWHHIDAPYQAYSTSVSADEVVSWYNTHGERLLDPALRPHFTGRADPAALNRLVTAPEEFWYFSSGITVICDRLEARFLARRAPGQPLLLQLDHARLVNGATELATLAQAVDQSAEAGHAALVPVRIICLDDAPPGLASALARAETPGAADPLDSIALDPVQAALRDEFADELHKEYVYKKDAVAPAPDAGCTMKEAAVALACAHPDVSLVARAGADPAYLWHLAPEGAYTRLFGGRPDAHQIWQCVLVLRHVRKALAYAAEGSSPRGSDLAKHGELLIAHLVFRSIDADTLDGLGLSADGLEDWAAQRTRDIADLVASAAEGLYGQHLFLASVFTDEHKCHVLAEDVTRSLTAPPAPVPDVSSGTRRRPPNSVVTLVNHGRIPEGTRVMYRPDSFQERAIGEWLSEDPRRYLAMWTNDPRRPLIWEVDQQAYSPSALVRHIWTEAAWLEAPSAVLGPRYWVIPGEGTLLDMALALTPATGNGGG